MACAAFHIPLQPSLLPGFSCRSHCVHRHRFDNGFVSTGVSCSHVTNTNSCSRSGTAVKCVGMVGSGSTYIEHTSICGISHHWPYTVCYDASVLVTPLIINVSPDQLGPVKSLLSLGAGSLTALLGYLLNPFSGNPKPSSLRLLSGSLLGPSCTSSLRCREITCIN